MNSIICLAGPTASGKTDLAVALAKDLDGEVVSCDSMQVYRRLNIGTAKPTVQEMDGVPHHMLDVAEPEEDFSVSRYCAMAAPIVEDILARGKTAIIAGGTGLYMDALIRGNDFAPFPATGVREALEKRAEAEGIAPLIAELRRVDPESAQRLPPADRKRIIRALEVYYETGETITQHNERTRQIPDRFSATWLGLDFEERGALYRRIDNRVDRMLEMGLLEEIRGLIADGIDPGCTAMQAIGYKEYLTALTCGGDISKATEQVKQSSRRYAKRQLTWFRRRAEMRWIHRREDSTREEIEQAARQLLREIDK